MLIPNLTIPNRTIPNRTIGIQTPKSHTRIHANTPSRRLSPIPDSPNSHLRPARQRGKIRQRSRIVTAPKPQVPNPSLLPLHDLLKSQVGLGRRRNRKRMQRGRIYIIPSP
jgi:hypothetical protein